MDLGQRNKIAPTGNMSSMTDLVFLLLIFFIILSTMVVNGEQVNLPESRGGTPNQGSKVALTINKDLQYFIGTDVIDKERVEIRLRALMESNDQNTIVLNVDKDVPTGETIEVLSMAKMNGWSIVVATKNKKG